MTTKKLTKLLALYLPIFCWADSNQLWRSVAACEGKELGDKIMSMMGTVPLAFANPLPSCIHLIFWWVCAAAQGYGWRSICVAKTQKSTATAWSMALPGGAPPRTLSRSWHQVCRQHHPDQNRAPDDEQSPA